MKIKNIEVTSNNQLSAEHLVQLLTPEAIKRSAFSFVRKQGYNSVNKIVLGTENKILERTRPGYRKITTDEYVPNAYLCKFGWKNTYYQYAVTEIELNVNEI